MTMKFRFLTVAILFLFTLGLALPQSAHAGFVGGVVDSVKGAVGSAVDSVKGAVGGVADTVKNTVSAGIAATSEVFTQVKESVKGVIGSFMGSAGNAIGGAVQQATGAISGVVSGTTGATGGAMDVLKNVGGKAMEMAGQFGQTISKVRDIMTDSDRNLFDKVRESITTFKEDLGGQAGDIGDLIAQGRDKLLEGLNDPSKLLGPVMDQAAENPVVEELLAMGKGLADRGRELFANVTERGSEILGRATELSGKILTATGDAVNQNEFLQNAVDYSNRLSEMVSARADAVQFNQQYGEVFNAQVENGGASAAASMNFAGLNVSTKDNIEDHATAIPGATDLTTRVDGSLGPRLDASVSYTGDNFEVSAATRNVVGLSAYGEGSLRWMEDGTIASASGHAQVAAGAVSSNELHGSVELSDDFGARADVVVSGLAGAEATARGNAYIGRNGIELGGEVGGRVGLWADAAGSTSVQYQGQNLFTASGSAGAGLGVGAEAGGNASFRLDRVGFNGSVTLGPFQLGGGVYVNPQAVAQLGFDRGRQAAEAAGSWVRSWFD